jgi:hypothetical protein
MTAPLRELFDEASAPPTPLPALARLDAVHRRIGRTRRRRVLAAGAAVAAVVLAVTGGAVALRGPAAAPPPAVPNATPSPTAKTIEGFPEYFEGARVVAAASATAPATTAKLTFTRTTKRLLILVRCSDPGLQPLVMFPGSVGIGVGCGTAAEYPNIESLDSRTTKTVTLTVNAMNPMPAGASIGIAIGVPVAFEDFPLPPRPSVLPTLPGPPSHGKVVATIRSAPGDPLTPRTVKVPVQDRFEIFARLSTPGSVQVSYRGQPFMTCVKWDYAPLTATLTELDFGHGCGEERITGDSDNPPKPGSLIEFKVIPAHVTGDWVVYIEAT